MVHYKAEVQQFVNFVDDKQNIYVYTDSKAQDALNSGDVNAAYEAIQTARDTADGVSSDFFNYSVPSDLPKDVKSTLKASSQDFFYAYSTQRDAWNASLKYLVRPIPSNRADATDRSAMAAQFFSKAQAELMSAEGEVGIAESGGSN